VRSRREPSRRIVAIASVMRWLLTPARSAIAVVDARPSMPSS
jgi:hypothetical protein